MKQTILTEKERQVLNDVVNSEYQDGDTVDHDIWLDYVISSKSRGGVLTSLAKKGFVTFAVVPMRESENRSAGISDSVIAITQNGIDALESSTRQ